MQNRGIELLPKSPPSGRSAIISFWARAIGIPLIIFLQILALGIIGFRVKLEFDLRSLQASIQEKEETLSQTEELEETFRNTKKRIDLIASAQEEFCYSCAIEKLDSIAPQGLSITDLTLENTKLNITARTGAGSDFALFVGRILNEEAVSEASILSGGLDKEGNFLFTMEMTLDKEALSK